MSFASSSGQFKTRILQGPPFISQSLLERCQRFWDEDDAQEYEIGYGWEHSEPIVVDEGLRWATEFGTDTITGAYEEGRSGFLEDEEVGDIFGAELKTVPPGFTRGFAFDVGQNNGLKEGKAIEIKAKPEVTTKIEKKEATDEALVEGVDSLKIDEQSGFTFIPHRKPDATKTSWARPVDANHVPLDYDAVVPHPAFEYPFELDPFQKQAIYHLERNESVFVAAHTSAGKTVVAEYAIALARKHLTKAIYTSPIKALSNQKFRDFKQTFGDVGLLTGDVQLNAEGAACLIMTTEILRSMLYRGAEMLADIEFVIFDEVHYVNDAERGVVWEEVIIMLPPHVTLIMLSATIPNTLEFADWVGRTKQKEIFVISTLKRPVPLEHFLYVRWSEAIRLVDAGRNFLEAGYKQACELVNPKTSNRSAGPVRGSKQERSLWTELTYMLRKKALLPAVIFTFSKRKCEENADGLGGLDLLGPGERSAVHLFLNSSFQRLKGTDAQLPQIERMREMIGRGVAVHHSGLLPIVKEAVEMLFGRGLVRVLFATETFAMGVNMPARTVVFSNLRKHDGTGFRTLLPGEYTQMAGRAGRRGLDPTGVVIIACPDEVPAEATLRQTLLGTPTRLQSRFRLTYHMILSMMRVQALCMEDVMRQSFAENAAQKSAPEGHALIQAHEDEMSNLERLDCVLCEGDLEEYYRTVQALLATSAHIYTWLLEESRQAARILEPGRLILLNAAFHRNTPAVVLRLTQQDGTQGRAVQVLVLQSETPVTEDAPLPWGRLSVPKKPTGYEVLNVHPTDIALISKDKIAIGFSLPQSLATPIHPADLTSLQHRLADHLLQSPKLEDLELPASKKLDIDEQRLNRRSLIARLSTFQACKCPDLEEHYSLHHRHAQLHEQLADLRFQLSDASMMLLPEYHARVQLLKDMEYIHPHSNLVLVKGRVAAEIGTTDELLTTELLFSNCFALYTPAEIVALMSSMVFQERQREEIKLEGRLAEGRDRITELAKDLVTKQRACGVDIAMDQALSALNFSLVPVVHEWALGKPFSQIIALTDVLEGSIVRCIVRLDETCRELRAAAKIMGDPALHKKMEEASAMIKRDICFASSLYI